MYHKAATCLCTKTSVQLRTPALRRINVHVNAKGFTIIELLVVIAIISLLISILLPSLRKAKELAYEVACTSNLHQIGTAWHLYLIDNNDTFPLRTGNIQWFYGGKHPSIGNEKSKELGLPALNYRPLNPYADMLRENESGIGLFRCPVDREIFAPNGAMPIWEGYSTYDFFGNSYMMNHNLLVLRDTKTMQVIDGEPFRLRHVEISTSMLVLAGDCQWYYSRSYYDANFHNYDDRVGMVFLDGHAGFIQLILDEETVPTDYTFSPYSPVEEEKEEE